MDERPDCAEKDNGECFWERMRSVIGDERPFSFAARMGIPKSTFSQCMYGNSVLPAAHLVRIAKATGCSVDWLLTGKVVAEQCEGGAPHYDRELYELMRMASTLPAEKRRLIADIVRRICEEHEGK